MGTHPIFESDFDCLTENEMTTKSEDKWAICFLLLLYFLQGLPLGLASSMVFLLQEHGVTYQQQAVFSIAHYPFSFKFLWAGLVDSVYFERFGRRKSWLFPVQMIVGVFLLAMSQSVDALLADKDVVTLAALFFIVHFLIATQDICVDGWALTLLSEEKTGAAANCNAAGQAFGVFVGYGGFMSLYSPEFCNKWLRSVPSNKGVITPADAIFAYAIIFLVVTVAVAFLKTEKALTNTSKPPPVMKTYKTMSRIVQLPPVRQWVFILFTIKIGTAAAGELAMLKMTERGLSRASLALLSSFYAPLRIMLPIVCERLTSKKALDVWFICLVYSIATTLFAPLLVYYMPHLVLSGNAIVVLGSLALLDEIFGVMEFVSVMSFHAQVSDPILGGVYMTILNSAANFGGMWPESTALWLIDHLGVNPINGTLNVSAIEAGTQTVDDFMGWDPYYALNTILVMIGIVQLVFYRPKLKYLDALSRSLWRVRENETSTAVYEKLTNEE